MNSYKLETNKLNKLLLEAVKDCDCNKIKELIAKGADINAKEFKEEYIKTPLHCAALQGELEIAILLIEQGADIDAQDIFYATPLYSATSQGNYEVVKSLIEHGANINAQRLDKKTALHCAVENEYRDIVKLLLEKGANENIQDHKGMKPIDYARSGANKEMIKIFNSTVKNCK